MRGGAGRRAAFRRRFGPGDTEDFLGRPGPAGDRVGSTLTPLERSSEYQGREFLTAEEVAALETAALAEEERLLKRPAERAPAGGNVDYRPDAPAACGLRRVGEAFEGESGD